MKYLKSIKTRLQEENIQTIINLKDQPSSDYIQWLESIPDVFEVVKDDPLAAFIEKGYPFNHRQEVGNCAWESLETGMYVQLVLGRLGLEFDKRDKEANKKILTEANQVFESWLQFTQLYALKNYLAHNSCDLNYSLITKVFEQGWRITNSQIGFSKKLEELEAIYLKFLSISQRVYFKIAKIRAKILQPSMNPTDQLPDETMKALNEGMMDTDAEKRLKTLNILYDISIYRGLGIEEATKWAVRSMDDPDNEVRHKARHLVEDLIREDHPVEEIIQAAGIEINEDVFKNFKYHVDLAQALEIVKTKSLNESTLPQVIESIEGGVSSSDKDIRRHALDVLILTLDKGFALEQGIKSS